MLAWVKHCCLLNLHLIFQTNFALRCLCHRNFNIIVDCNINLILLHLDFFNDLTLMNRPIFYDFVLTVFLAHHYYLLILVTRIHLRHKAVGHESHDWDKVSQLALVNTILILLENAEELSVGNLHNLTGATMISKARDSRHFVISAHTGEGIWQMGSVVTGLHEGLILVRIILDIEEAILSFRGVWEEAQRFDERIYICESAVHIL